MTGCLLAAGAMVLQGLVWSNGPSLPQPVSNNAVVAASTATGPAVFSFLGLDSTKRWDGAVNWAFRWDLRGAAWRPIAPVPGSGRLAGTAQTVGGKIYLFGGYTVAADGSETTLPNVDIYDPHSDRWSAGAPIPVPVDDAVSGAWRDSLIYLVSGWHDRANVRDVQIYDPARDRWQAATAIPGPLVFGHAGAIVGNTIVYLDGVRLRRFPRRFVAEASSWRGDIDPARPTRITWTRLPDHPGPARYRAGAGAGIMVVTAERQNGRTGGSPLIVFAGGTDNPYNYDGIGYNGLPSEPLGTVFAYDVAANRWRELPPLPQPIMDLRGIAVAGDRVVIVGGMGAERRTRRAVIVGSWKPAPTRP